MQTFFAMLLTLRAGLVPGPADSAALSIRDAAVQSFRQETLQVARAVVARDVFTGREPVRVIRLTNVVGRTRQQTQGSGWGPPPVVNVIAKEDWRDAMAATLNGNAKLANAVMWVASAPVRLNVNHEKVYLAITIRIP
jgi:hypothetical protein